MANSPKAITELPALTTPAVGDLLVIVDDPSGTANTKKITVSTLFSNTPALAVNVSSLSTNTLIMKAETTPSNSTITVTKGTVLFDTNYIYIAVANNQLKRVALSSF